ncbi:DUF4166 domain-containing protein [Piscibacillus halophilus]|uniref:DUF4166 domain-containing protein n=1 Tax=Piscibacillus halophilus TaxID=571933 RepID=UPI00240948C4|nr:DUF4166 domain-containing protein [Piscibacillus halophilus]
MSIYKQVLGEDFHQLHPMLQKRYEMMGERPIRGEGVMTEIQGGPKLLKPLMKLGMKRKLLFPESGEDVPFTIINSPRGKRKQIHWERQFHFPNNTRYFNALMSLNEESLVIEDYLGEPALVYSDLIFKVDSGALTIRSHKQRLVLGKIEIPLPRWFQGLAVVKESYHDQSKKFEIAVQVRNPLMGQIFSYKGEFTSEDIT